MNDNINDKASNDNGKNEGFEGLNLLSLNESGDKGGMDDIRKAMEDLAPQIAEAAARVAAATARIAEQMPNLPADAQKSMTEWLKYHNSKS